MNNIEQNKKFWDEHFSKINLDYPNEEVIRFMGRYSKDYPNGTFLDWGCATGRHVVLGCKFGYKVYAVDYVKRCIDITRDKVRQNGFDENKVTYYVNDGLDIPQIEDNSINVMLVWGVMMGLTSEQQRLILKNIYRMLSEGGRAFIDFRTENDSLNLKNTEVVNKKLENSFSNTTTLDEVKALMQESGLLIENTEKYEFTENNGKVLNSWWHIVVRK